MQHHTTTDGYHMMMFRQSEIPEVMEQLRHMQQDAERVMNRRPTGLLEYSEGFDVFVEMLSSVFNEDTLLRRYGRLWGAVSRLTYTRQLVFGAYCTKCYQHVQDGCRHIARSLRGASIDPPDDVDERRRHTTVHLPRVAISEVSFINNQQRFERIAGSGVGRITKEDYSLFVERLVSRQAVT